mgnify:CR=1 FL=1
MNEILKQKIKEAITELKGAIERLTDLLDN